MNEQIPEWLKQKIYDASDPYASFSSNGEVYTERGIELEKLFPILENYFLSRSGGVWVKATTKLPELKKRFCGRVLHEDNWYHFSAIPVGNDRYQRVWPIETLKISPADLEWLDESPAADKGDAIADTLRVQEAILKHKVKEAIKTFHVKTGYIPDLNIKGDFKKRKVILIETDSVAPRKQN